MNPAIQVIRASQLVDEPVSLQVSGLQPNILYAIRVELQDEIGRTWRSEAQFQANDEGAIDTAIQAPSEGSYTGADGSGLFWSLRLLEQPGELSWDDPRSIPFYMKMSLDPNVYQVTLTQLPNSSVIAEQQFEMSFLSEDVVVTNVNDGFIGQYFMPAQTENKTELPAVIVVGGSGGGFAWSTHVASLLASRGMAAMAVAYFDYAGNFGLPNELIDIPLEPFGTCIEWLKQRKEVDRTRISVFGISKGAELSLLLGTTFNESLHAITAIAPSHVVMQGISMGSNILKSSWSYKGQPLAFLPYPDDYMADMSFDKSRLRDITTRALQNKESVEQSRIPVERMKANVLLISGDKDELGPTTEMCFEISETLSRHSYPYTVKHLRYSDAGHSFFVPNLPAVTINAEVNPSAVAKAEREAWAAILSFFQKS